MAQVTKLPPIKPRRRWLSFLCRIGFEHQLERVEVMRLARRKRKTMTVEFCVRCGRSWRRWAR